MKFEDMKFKNKERVKRNTISLIIDELKHSLDFEKLAYWNVYIYCEVLIDDQEYNLKSNVFYDKLTNRKLNIKFLAAIAHDYILEHIQEFQKRT